MTTSPEIEAELDLALKLMPQYEAIFIDRGYRLLDTFIERDKVLADGRVFVFQNDRAGRRIALTYYPPKRATRSFALSVEKPDGPYFTLRNYLSKHKHDAIEDRLMPKAGEVEDFWRDHFAALADLLATDSNLRAIIDGKTWEDVPIDWQGYK